MGIIASSSHSNAPSRVAAVTVRLHASPAQWGTTIAGWTARADKASTVWASPILGFFAVLDEKRIIGPCEPVDAMRGRNALSAPNRVWSSAPRRFATFPDHVRV